MLSRIRIRCTDRTQQIVLPDSFPSSTETTIGETATTLNDKRRQSCMRNSDNDASETSTALHERIVRAANMYSIYTEFLRGVRLEWCVAGRTVVRSSERCRKYILGAPSTEAIYPPLYQTFGKMYRVLQILRSIPITCDRYCSKRVRQQFRTPLMVR